MYPPRSLELGYASPEYLQTGRLTSKNDVWSYGVFLYELITGRRLLDHNRPKSEQKLLDWVKPYLSNTKKFKKIVDPRLEGKCSLKSVYNLSMVVNRCLVKNQKSRPMMSEVLEMVNKIMERMKRGLGVVLSHREVLLRPSLQVKPKRQKRRVIDWKITENSRFGRVRSPKLVKAH